MNFCFDCKKRIQNHNKRCRKCNGIYHTGKNGTNYKHGKCCIKHYCKDCKKKISYNSAIYGKGRCAYCAGKKACWHKHHLYLRKFKKDKIIIMRNSKHTLLHRKVYEYLLETQGKIAIRKYLKWFIKKYKGVN
jgi:hypothetical protein